MWVSRREYDTFKRFVETELDGGAQRMDRVSERVEHMSDEVSGLRGDVRSYAKMGAILISVLGIAAPFVAAHVH
jgi:hypothetical protein